MAKKTKGKSRKHIDPLIANKIKQIREVQESFRGKASEYETYLTSRCNILCEKIEKLYMDRLKAIPEDIRNMTVEELMKLEEEKEKAGVERNSVGTNLEQQRMQFEKNKLMSEKKKNRKLSRMERKRSVSVSSAGSVQKRSVLKPSEAPCNLTRVLSESSLHTPLSKKSAIPVHSVTPKFNTKIPINKAFLRPPRVGEVVMSLSGSPLQNLANDVVKPVVKVSIDGGMVLKIEKENEEAARLQREFMKECDDYTKSTLADARKKIDEILKS